MTARKSSSTGKKRRLRPLRRALLLLMAGLLAFGLLRTTMWTYSRVFGEKVLLAKPEVVALSPLYVGDGVILRDEVVIVAPRPGTVNVMVQSTAEVSAGDEILEIVDRDRLAEIESLISVEQEKQGGSSQDATAVLANAEAVFKQATQNIRDLTVSYALAIRQGAISQATSLFRDIGRAAAQLDQSSNDFQLALDVSDELGSRYEELLAQRATAIHKMVAPVAGIVTWVVDEMSGAASSALAPGEVRNVIGNKKPAAGALSGGSHIAGGSAICAIVDPATIALVIEVVNAPWLPEDSIEVTINGQMADVEFWKSEALAEDVTLYYFSFTSISPQAIDLRWVDIEIWPVREATFSVSASSLTHVDGVPTIYVVDEEGTVFAVEVELLEDNGTDIIVSGLPGDLWIVSTPELVAAGDTVTKPKGD